MCSTSRIAVIGCFRVSDPFKIGAPTSLSLLKANWIGVDTTKPTNYIYLYTINNKNMNEDKVKKTKGRESVGLSLRVYLVGIWG